MEEKSRVKKFEDLRQSLDEEKHNTDDVKQVWEGLKNTSVETSESKYEPSHQKQTQNDHLVDETGDFKNEYLDGFIQEVRDYNIKKGIRDNEDTRLDILQQLSAKQRKKRATYMEELSEAEKVSPDATEEPIAADSLHLESETPLFESEYVNEEAIASTQEIARQVQELLAETTASTTVDEAEEEEEEVADIKEEPSILPIAEEEEGPEEEISRDRLLEETLKLKVQLDEYEDELTTLNDGVSKNNKLLNIVISVLVILLFSIIGVVVYWMVSGGYF